MRIDRYTKVILTIVAVALFSLIVQSGTTTLSAQAVTREKFGYVHPVSNTSYFDTNTGEMYTYDGATGKLVYHWKIVELGKPLQLLK
ncbi:MAG: hypothetical protein KKH85_04620 [Proteobacteria bacterium]|nr:hypothetical protein [Pseudomonadota bacterium]